MSLLQTSATVLAPMIRGLSEPVLAVFQEAAKVLKPPPKTTVSQWAERERILSTESSAAPGRYRCALAPYQRGMMDAVNIPGVEEIVYFTSAQVGKSLCLENILGYFMHEDPCPVVVMWPTELVGKAWSIDTLAPMIRDTPALRELIVDAGRNTGNSMLFKKFAGGWLAIVGANAPSSLRRRRARVVIADEVDGYGASAGAEGDPILLVAKRSTTFWNRLRILSSTCTTEGESRIDAAYENSDQRKYFLPCPHCTQANGGRPDGFQVLQWKRLDKKTAEYPCEHCGAVLTELDKVWMLKHGEWRAARPEVTKVVGFWINEMYSPFVTWSEMAENFLKAVQQRENPELLKTFINLSLAETWKPRGDDKVGADELRRRLEDYGLTEPRILPAGVAVLTAGVDVQADRLEIEVVGWGRGLESWSIDYARFEGDTAQPDVWEKLDEYLKRTFPHELAPNDIELEIASAFVDSGFRTAHVYAFTKPRADSRIYASKGVNGFGKPPVAKPNRNNKANVKMFPIAVDVIKELVYSWLKIAPLESLYDGKAQRAGYMHFSRAVNDLENADYFAQLTAERIERKNKNGFPVRFWVLPPGRRNEALDCRVYATAALHSLVEKTPIAVLLENLHKGIVDRAKVLLARRRAKVDPNQLGLLDQLQEKLVERQAAAVAETAEKVLADGGAPGEPSDQVAEPIVEPAKPAAPPPAAPDPDLEPARPTRIRSNWARGF